MPHLGRVLGVALGFGPVTRGGLGGLPGALVRRAPGRRLLSQAQRLAGDHTAGKFP